MDPGKFKILLLTTYHVMNCGKSYVIICNPSVAYLLMCDKITSLIHEMVELSSVLTKLI